MSNWRKSSHSTANGACVEVGGWRKSSHSAGNGECVEVGSGTAVIAVRDTKFAESPVLAFSAGAWERFVLSLK